jgi:hypothetical protein
MADLVVIVPSRGRPDAAAELAEAARRTCSADTLFVIAVDGDDASWDLYAKTATAGVCSYKTRIGDGRPTMVRALNTVALQRAFLPDDPPFAIGFMGDDHRPRTKGWDAEYLDALHELGTGIVYGNDLYQGEKVPTQCAMTADIIRALGYMCPPTLRHMYVDNFWLDLGSEADCLVYLPDVVVEHMHPVAGKADWDEGHKRVNAREVYDADALAYGEHHTSGRFAADVAKVRALGAAR